jgi:hypothetical protein
MLSQPFFNPPSVSFILRQLGRSNPLIFGVPLPANCGKQAAL